MTSNKKELSMKFFAARLLLLSAIASVLMVPAYGRGKKSIPKEPGKYMEWGPDIDEIEIVKTFSFADYTRIDVEPFDTKDAPLPEKDDNTYEPVKKSLANSADAFVSGLREHVTAQKVAVNEKPEKEAGSLIIRGKVLNMDPGSQAARYWAGGAAGGAKVQLSVEIIDARTDEVLVRFTQERSANWGVTGGAYDKLLWKDLKQIGEDAANVLKVFSGS
jgi:hypothetical protein